MTTFRFKSLAMFCAVAGISASQVRAKPDGVPTFLSGADLAKRCLADQKTGQGLVLFAECKGYVMAVADTHIMSSDGLGVKPFFCVPSNLDSDSVIDLVKAKLRQTDSHQYAAASVVLEALMRFYPCDKPQ